MVTKKIELNAPERFSGEHKISREKLVSAAQAATDKLERLAKISDIGFPGTCSQDFRYKMGQNNNWECGMYTGCYWLAYEITGNKFFRTVAEKQIETFKYRLNEKIEMDDHDVGFVFTPSCVAGYKITGNEEMRSAALNALTYFYEHSYSKQGRFIIRAHTGWNDGWGCRTMMDSLMNTPLLFWGANETGKAEYAQAAKDHVKTTEQLLIRADGSSFHHFQFDPKTAAPVRGLTFQGHKDDSCWSRGHAWGIYGIPIAYSYSKEEYLVKLHRDITYFMLNRLPSDMIPYWDYDFIEGSTQPRDSSAGVTSVCGLLEMAKMLPQDSEEKHIYTNAAAHMLESVIDNCTGDIGVDYDGLICHVTHALPQGHGIDECAVYGDYFYLEALQRSLNPDWKKYW